MVSIPTLNACERHDFLEWHQPKLHFSIYYYMLSFNGILHKIKYPFPPCAQCGEDVHTIYLKSVFGTSHFNDTMYTPLPKPLSCGIWCGIKVNFQCESKIHIQNETQQKTASAIKLKCQKAYFSPFA